MAELSGRRRFAHLFRRAGFGPNEPELNAAIALHPNEDTAYDQAVNNLINATLAWSPNYMANDGVPDRFDPMDGSVTTDGVAHTSAALWWLERMVRTKRPLLEKMALFWHNHFATALEKDGLSPAQLHRQIEMFRSKALGNFEDILNAVCTDPAMMVWLDLVSNRRSSPNENYAREVFELFALGVATPQTPNYTEADIAGATRAFTGHSIDPGGNFFLNAGQHDNGNKTVFGQTGNWGYQDINRMIVQRIRPSDNVHICSYFMAAKLFSWFVWPVLPSDPVVPQFAQVFRSNNFSINHLVSAILKSPEFSSNRAYRAQVKSPIEQGVGALRTLGAARFPFLQVFNRFTYLGQKIMYPPDVNGWPSGRTWLNASTIISRWNMNADIVHRMGYSGRWSPSTMDHMEPGGPTMEQILQGYGSVEQKVDRALDLMLQSDVPANTRNAIVSVANQVAVDGRDLAPTIFKLVMNQPAYFLN
jgi:uncharacterized protein (DUF1800 family)